MRGPARCKRCGELIEFGILPNGHRVPLNIDEDHAGGVIRTGGVDWAGSYRIAVYENRQVAQAAVGLGVRTYSRHKDTCPGRHPDDYDRDA